MALGNVLLLLYLSKTITIKYFMVNKQSILMFSGAFYCVFEFIRWELLDLVAGRGNVGICFFIIEV